MENVLGATSHPPTVPSKKARIFVAGIATEVNTFSPIFIATEDFANALLARPNEHPEKPTLCTSPLVHARTFAKAEQIELVEGTTCWADPGGAGESENLRILTG